MRRIRVRIRKGKVIEPADLPEEVEGWLEPTEGATHGPLEAAMEEDIWAGYDPEKVRAALRERTGILTEDEAEKLIANIYRWREEGSRPAD